MIYNEHRQFQEKWEIQYFFVEHRNTPKCPICTEKVAVHKENNIKRHISTKHDDEYEKYKGEERANQVVNLKTYLLRQKNFLKKGSKDSWAAVEDSYATIEMIAKVGSPFTGGEYVKKYILQAANIVFSETKSQFSTIRISANTVADHISQISSNMYEQLCEKATYFSAYSIALDESTDITDTAQLAIYLSGIDDNLQVIAELLTIFRRLCDAIVNAGLPWKRLAGITTNGAPSVTGGNNGLVSPARRQLKERGIKEAIALQCTIHQQTKCSKRLNSDNMMSVVVNCINQVTYRGSKQLMFHAVLEETESEYKDVLITDVIWLSKENV